MPVSIPRRAFLRSTGVALALPCLEAMQVRGADANNGTDKKRRMVAICTYLGMHNPYLIPTKAGRDYEMTPYLEAISDFRDDLTVFSGLSHPDVDGGHSSVSSFLTAAPHPGSSSFKNSISLDQFAAEQLASNTRFSYLALSTNGGGLSWTRGGVRIPTDDRPSRLFAKLFLNGTPEEIQQQVRRLKEGQSIMDLVRGQAKQLERQLGKQDREKLGEYFSAVRDLEGRLLQAEEWSRKPKPKVNYKMPRDVTDKADFVARLKLMFDLAHLALETDSTRIITLSISGTNLVPPISGVSTDWHNLSHHGKDPQKLEQLKIIELEKMRLLNEFLTKLKKSPEDDETLLDKTMVLFGSNLGNASSHNTRDLPILLAGGGFRHGQHLAFDREKHPPLCNVYVSMLQQLGLDVNSFASGTGPLNGLESKS
ncbi:MAG: hypothetical protein CMJ78_22865 [Planctomycetaceae bacterium]|nr:hypothetical protein [Planctomycetaceae bacterium]